MRVVTAGRVSFTLMLTWMFLGGCSSSPTAVFHPEPTFEGRELSPRETPAEVTRRSERDLRANGYVAVGTVVVRHEEGGSYGVDPTTEARREAAARGGDVVILKSDNEKTVETRLKQGRCLGETTEPVWVNDYRTVCNYSVRPAACSQQMVGGHMESRSVCAAWEQLPYEVTVTMTEARVFRRDAAAGQKAAARRVRSR